MGKLDDRAKRKLDIEYNRYMDRFGGLVFREVQPRLEEIAAMTDVYHYLTEYGDLDERETAFMLTSDSPLRALRDRWLYEDKDISDSLSEALWSLCASEQSGENENDEREGHRIDKDKFYIKDGRVEWVYFNPDSGAGGQYVYNMLNAYVIGKAAQTAGTDAEKFFDHAGLSCVQYLVDADTFGFAEADYHFKNAPCDFEGCNEDTMAALISLSQEWRRGERQSEPKAGDEDEWEG